MAQKHRIETNDLGSIFLVYSVYSVYFVVQMFFFFSKNFPISSPNVSGLMGFSI